MKTAFTTVEMGCYSKCMQNTPHDLYSKCIVCGSYNQEKKSPADYERERESAKRATQNQSKSSWDFGF